MPMPGQCRILADIISDQRQQRILSVNANVIAILSTVLGSGILSAIAIYRQSTADCFRHVIRSASYERDHRNHDDNPEHD